MEIWGWQYVAQLTKTTTYNCSSKQLLSVSGDMTKNIIKNLS